MTVVSNLDVDELVIDGFNSARTDALALKSGQSYTFNFHNQSNGTIDWENYVVFFNSAVGEEYFGDDQVLLRIRGDNFGWGPVGNLPRESFDTNINFGTWMSECQQGFDVQLTISRSGNTLGYYAVIGGYYSRIAVTSAIALPETVYVFLTGENCTLTNITSTPGNSMPPAPTPLPDPDPPKPSATSKIEGDLTVGAYRSVSTNAVALKTGEYYTFKFNNKSNGAANWENFVIGLSDGTGDIILIRADNFGFGDGTYFPTIEQGGVPGFETDINWDTWVQEAQAGLPVEVTISREGNVLTYNATIGSHYVKATLTSKIDLPETVALYITGENCVLTGITTETNAEGGETSDPKPSDPTPTDPTPTDPEPSQPTVAPEIKGDLTVTSFFNEKTNMVPLKTGEYYTFKFNNKSNGTDNWNNFILAVVGATGAAYTGADQEVLIIRADQWGWGGGMSDFVAPDGDGNKLVFDSNADFTNWVTEMAAGVDVELKLSRDGNTLTYEATIGNHTMKLTATSGKALPETLYVFLTGDNCVLTGITTETNAKGGETTDPTPTEPQPTEPQPTQPANYPKIEGTLKVTGFFNEKTNMVPLKSGEKYTFTFKNKSSGTNNWENFVLAVVGATGAAYTGADQEILIIRADNWGWGGGMSDFVAPDGTGNKLTFDSNINWDTWVKEMQSGLNVRITISRKGNTLTYNATIGNYYVKMTATSGKALPETAYVFLTGENCTLSNIKTVAAPGYTSPATGDDLTVLWIAVMALLASLAVAAAAVAPRFLRKK